MEAYEVKVFDDSQLVIGQFKGEYEVKEPTLLTYVKVAQELLLKYQYTLEWIPHLENSKANTLGKLVSTKVITNN